MRKIFGWARTLYVEWERKIRVRWATRTDALRAIVEAKRLERQLEIGEPVFQMFCKLWQSAGGPDDRLVWKNPNHEGVYWAGVSQKNGQKKREHIMTVAVHLQLLSDRQHVEIAVGGHKWGYNHVPLKQIEYLASRFKVF